MRHFLSCSICNLICCSRRASSFFLFRGKQASFFMGFTTLLQVTFPTLSLQVAITLFIPVNITFGKRMSVFTMSFSGVCRKRANALRGIVSGSDLLKMARMDTRFYATQMVNVRRRINLFNKQGICQAMGYIVQPIYPNLSVSILCWVSQPTWRFVAGRFNLNSGKDSSKKFSRNLNTVIISVGHFGSFIANLIKAVSVLKALPRPVFIVS